MFSRVRSIASARVAIPAPQNSFHTSAASLARPRRTRKETIIQIRKNNLLKQERKRLEVEEQKPDYIIGRPTEFTQSLLSPRQVFQAPLEAIKKPSSASQEPTDSTTTTSTPFSFGGSSSSSSIFGSLPKRPLDVTTSNPSGYQHFLTNQEAELLFETVPQVQVQEHMVRSSLVNEKTQLPIEQQKAELVRRITAIENANAKQVVLENVRRARLAFQRVEGDTGSPEVQAAVMTVRIHNLHDHVTRNRKDKHNYRRLRVLIHQRQSILKYLKKTDPDRYHICLDRLGLEPRAIEDEIVI
ncbi:hypothetical protein DFQ27_009438 [Actinomortierella ambigua]|uniref:Ribosomal protein S15 n=1 Tax=Actinomortierella ambigua TaxID=1343610 RepID=A0A9P6UAW5_9FUNG|nr:hypothetical protein DFQ27_009438 [Actinomortierella ambigua]